MGEKLKHIFKYYCSFGDRLNETFLTNPKFFKFIKDAGIIGDNFRPADVDIVFNQVVRLKQGGRGSVMPGSRIDYDQFVSALGRISERKYQTETRVALRHLMTTCVLPLYDRLRHKPTFLSEVVQVGREEVEREFAREFLKPEVVRCCSSR